jgi:hypothetical protein
MISLNPKLLGRLKVFLEVRYRLFAVDAMCRRETATDQRFIAM